MSTNTIDVYKKLRKDPGKVPAVLISLNVLSFISLILAATTSIELFKMLGSLFPFFLIVGIVYLVSKAVSSGGLKHTIRTLEATGSIKYIDEIFNNEYKTNGNVCFSKHLLYIPYHNVIAYKDIVNISTECTTFPLSGTSEFVLHTIDGRNHKIMLSTDIMKEFLNHQRHILFNANSNEYKHKIEEFQALNK